MIFYSSEFNEVELMHRRVGNRQRVKVRAEDVVCYKSKVYFRPFHSCPRVRSSKEERAKGRNERRKKRGGGFLLMKKKRSESLEVEGLGYTTVLLPICIAPWMDCKKKKDQKKKQDNT